jgi:hypothetical protein
LKQALDESEKRAAALERENVVQKQLADASQMELKQALDESEKRAVALERENIAQKAVDAKQMELKQALDESEKRAVALERENVAQKHLADARQMELKQALDESEKRALALERESVAQKQLADAGQMDLKQALDESEKRAVALERENVAQKQLADAGQLELKQALDESEKRAVALERENVAQKQLADARQRDLKQALDESEKRALALERELTSVPKALASAERSNSDGTTRDALSRPMQGSEIIGSMPAPQSRVNLSAGLHTASQVTPEDTTGGNPGVLNQSQPARSLPPHVMTSAEEAKLVARAESLINHFDFVSARLLLANALEKGSARAAFMMAETYDGQILRSLQAFGVRGDVQKAREFYQLAAAGGMEKARERVEALQSDADFDASGVREDRSR